MDNKQHQIKTTRYCIKEVNLMNGNLPLVKRHNNYAHILIIKNQIDEMFENYFQGQISYVYESYDNVLKYTGDSDELLDFWVKQYEATFIRIPKSKRAPYTTQDAIDGLDHGI